MLPCTERCCFGLIGDPKQLAPTVMSWVVARYGYGVSMFERPMYTGGMECGRCYEPREMRREADSHCLATHALTCARADVRALPILAATWALRAVGYNPNVRHSACTLDMRRHAHARTYTLHARVHSPCQALKLSTLPVVSTPVRGAMQYYIRV